MSLPSINQVRHLFVANTATMPSATNTDYYNGTPSAEGNAVVCGKKGADAFLFIKHYGKGGIVASDKILKENLVSATFTSIDDLKSKIGNHTIQVTSAVAGQVYEIKLQFIHYGGLGEQDQTYKIGMYKAKSDDTAALIAAGLAKSLQDALGLDNAANAADLTHYKEQLCTITVNSDTITVHEADLSGLWKRGKISVEYMPIHVFLGNIYTSDDYETDEWATVTHNASLTTVNDAAKKLADLEYFCMGARGDEYRGMGYPRNFDTEYFLTGGDTLYGIIDLQYFYQGDNEDIQKSQKTLSIVVPTAAVRNTIAGGINTILGTSLPAGS